MVAFLNTSKAYAEIEAVIDKATSNVFLISPYIRFPKPLLERLIYKDKQGLKTIVVCREKDLNKDLGSQVRTELKELKNLELRFDDDLHAKCFFNQESMVITSLNLLDSSEKKNREMGILLSLKEDEKVFQEALNEAKYIINRAKRDSAIKNIFKGVVKEAKKVMDSPPTSEVRKPITPRRAKATSKTVTQGFCIRCGKSISYDLDKPYCLPCARAWKKAGGYNDHREKQCHQCGSKVSTITYDKPICGSCYYTK